MTVAKPLAPYWHLWTDAEGVSHQTRCQMTEFELRSIQPTTEPQWQGTRMHANATILFSVLPVGWIGQWHENPKPQWIVPLSGRWFVESMDMKRVEMGPGEVSFGEDQNSRERDGRMGHRSGTVGSEPAALMIIQLDDGAHISSPCRFT
jgi:hypothetical protein